MERLAPEAVGARVQDGYPAASSLRTTFSCAPEVALAQASESVRVMVRVGQRMVSATVPPRVLEPVQS